MFLQKHTYLIYSILILTIFPFAHLHSESKELTASDSTHFNYLPQNQVLLSDSVINYGKLFLKTPYHYGSPGTSSFDCSGFTSYVYRNFGYNLGRSSSEQSRQFDSVDRSQLKVGDLVFFSGRRRSKNVGHVGIVVSSKENGEFNFIHAAVHNGVTISNSSEAYYTKRFLKASRVIGANPILTVFHTIITKTFKKDADVNKQTLAQSQPNQITKIKKIIPAEFHQVKSGETLSSIAQQYGLTIAELKQKNNIKGRKLKLKQRIKVKDEETIVETLNVTINTSTQNDENKNSAVKTESSKFSQEASTLQASFHIVKKGETLFSISKLYNISVDELKKINNVIVAKIHPGQEIKLNHLPELAKKAEVAEVEAPQKVTTHKVISGESLFSISKLYNIPIDELKKINNLPTAKIRPGQELKLFQDSETKTKNIVVDKSDNKQVIKTETSEKTIIHKIKKGESLISIANENNISVEELKKINNLADSKIRSGQKLKLTQSTEKTKIENEPKSIRHKVKSGESYYSIAKDYGCSINDLKGWNNKSGSKIKPGDKLIVYPNGK